MTKARPRTGASRARPWGKRQLQPPNRPPLNWALQIW